MFNYYINRYWAGKSAKTLLGAITMCSGVSRITLRKSQSHTFFFLDCVDIAIFNGHFEKTSVSPKPLRDFNHDY